MANSTQSKRQNGKKSGNPGTIRDGLKESRDQIVSWLDDLLKIPQLSSFLHQPALVPIPVRPSGSRRRPRR